MFDDTRERKRFLVTLSIEPLHFYRFGSHRINRSLLPTYPINDLSHQSLFTTAFDWDYPGSETRSLPEDSRPLEKRDKILVESLFNRTSYEASWHQRHCSGSGHLDWNG